MTWQDDIRRAGASHTDLALRDRFVAECGEDLRFAEGLNWLVWDGRRWCPGARHMAVSLAAKSARGYVLEAAGADTGADKARSLRFAAKAESRRAIEAVVELAKIHPDVRIDMADLDADPWLLNVVNGTIDLRTGAMREHRREDYCTKMSPVEFDLGAKAPGWLRFLSEMQPDPDVRAYIQRWVGYCLTGLMGEQVFTFNHGIGENGKGVWESTLLAMLGGYAVVTPFDTFLPRQPGRATNDLAALRGARLACASEPEEGCHLAEGTIKSITGEDPLTVRYPYQEFFTFQPTCKVMLTGNHKPRIRGTDHAIWRRVILVPWGVRVAEQRRDRSLRQKLRVELPGILLWAVRGCGDWSSDGLRAPAPIRAAVQAYRDAEDHVGGFLASVCVLDEELSVPVAMLKGAYMDWCAEEGERPVSAVRFNASLSARGLCQDRLGKLRTRVWQGISLTDRRTGSIGELPPTGVRR